MQGKAIADCSLGGATEFGGTLEIREITSKDSADPGLPTWSGGLCQSLTPRTTEKKLFRGLRSSVWF